MCGKLVSCLTLIGIAIACDSTRAEVPDEFLETPLATAFGEPPTIANPMLAPDGSRLLFLGQNPLGISMLLSVDFEGGAVDTVLEPIEDGYDILWCRFANETRVLCDMRRVGLPNETTDYHRYVAVNADGTELRAMPPRLGCQWHDHVRDQPFVDWVPDDPEQILLLCPMSAVGPTGDGGGPKLLDIYRGRIGETRGADDVGGPRTQTLSQSGRQMVLIINERLGPGTIGRGQRLYANGHGVASHYRGRQDNVDRWFAWDGDRRWHEFLSVDPLVFESPFRPAGYGSDLDRLFNIAWDAEALAWGLYRQTLMGEESARVNERVFSRAGVDIELVDTMGPHQRVVAAAFLEGSPRRAIVDPRVAEVYQSVAALLPDIEVEIVDESWDQNRYLIRTRVPNRAPNLMLVDMENETVEPIVPEYAHLVDVELAATTFVEFESSTGGSITGNLTLPRDRDGPVPAVILPRSEPRHEALADPHYLVQFLAANGYAVFRVNNRVEEAYGRGWVAERAIAGWSQSADDINDAAGFLIEQGIAAPGLICGAGKDYGAYVALITAIKYPELFGCIVSIAGVTHPPDTPGGILLTGRGDRDQLAEASPGRRVAELEAPVLMFHGWGDTDVDVAEHSLRFATEAETAGKGVTFIEYPYANHEIRQRQYRIDMLARIRGFLAEHIGPELRDEEKIDAVAR